MPDRIPPNTFTELVTRVMQLTQLVQNELVAGEDLTQYQLVRFVGGVLKVASSDDISRMPVDGMVLASVSSGETVDMLDEGVVENPSWSFTPGNPIYAGPNGTIVQTPPSTPNSVVQKLGVALTATKIYFDPDKTFHIIQ